MTTPQPNSPLGLSRASLWTHIKKLFVAMCEMTVEHGKETIINGKTGILINNINEYKLIEAIKNISVSSEIYRKNCIKRAKKFDTILFVDKIKEEIKKVIENE